MPYQSLKIFISSPNDVADERAFAEKVIADVNRSCRDTLGIHVESHTWQDLPPLAVLSESTIQQVIMDELRTCNVFVLILYKRYGALEPGQTKSNTAREIDVALQMANEGSMIFLPYFRNLPPNVDPGEQEEQVRRLREELIGQRLLFRPYTDADEFRERFTHDFYHAILKHFVGSAKQQTLKQFWQFGIRDSMTHPRLAIVYPPLDRYFMRQQDPDNVWLERLVPHVVFEDSKAMQKVEKTLRLIGFRDFDFFNTSAPPYDIDELNRLWLCLPRSVPAQQRLEQYEQRARFRFGGRSLNAESCIYWRRPGSKRFFAIHSPLGQYLREQRRGHHGGNWTNAHGRIFAKDFAVLARFSDRSDRVPMQSGTLKDFFLAGIRGLGTWGAGWFIDRRYNALSKQITQNGEDIQLLLEVTYQNEHIHDVQVVSEKPESYFQQENDPETIRRKIEKHTSCYPFDTSCTDATPVEREPVTVRH